MRDYTYQDMLKMQEDAANRVREMKKRATLIMEEDPKPPSEQTPIPDDVKHISYPVEIEPVEDEEPATEENKHSGIIEFLTQDKDALLILSLIAVLSMESNDYFTTYALLYLLL